MKTSLSIVLLALSLMLCACGNKGPLFLPVKTPADAAPAPGVPVDGDKSEAPPFNPAFDVAPAAAPAEPVQSDDGG